MTAPGGAESVVLSICIPTRNRVRYLDNLLGELSKQIDRLGCSWEILIGDNCSNDASAEEVVQRHAARLAIRYFRRDEDIGALNNLSLLYEVASGKYCVYLADDDFLIIDTLREIIQFLESNPQVGAVQAPWLNHDRVTGEDCGQFYFLERNTVIERQDFRGLLSLVLEKHIFPEIHVCRTSLIKRIYRGAANHAYWAFVQSSVMLNNASICFWSKPFYKFVLRYWLDEPHIHAGNEETKKAWDRYRGGLEYILSYFSHQLSAEERRRWLNEIERFTLERMAIGLRLRTQDPVDWIENYYVANRLLAAGAAGALGLSYEQYRLNAAMDYLLALRPFAPTQSRLAYLSSEPPHMLVRATQFGSTPWLVLDRQDQLPDFSVVLTNRDVELNDKKNVLTISESTLLGMFP